YMATRATRPSVRSTLCLHYALPICLKASVFLCIFAPAGTIAFNQHGCPVFKQKNNFVRNWAVSKKLVTGFAQILVGVIKIYLFGSYLHFMSLYTFLVIKLFELPLNLYNDSLKFKIKVFKILKIKKLLAKN